jgi:membrane protease YdiL (CAAX protease family)
VKRFWSWLPWIAGWLIGWNFSAHHIGFGWTVLVGAASGVVCFEVERAWARR